MARYMSCLDVGPLPVTWARKRERVWRGEETGERRWRENGIGDKGIGFVS